MTLAQERMRVECTTSPDFRNEVDLMGPPCSGSCSVDSCLLLQAFLQACLLSAAMYLCSLIQYYLERGLQTSARLSSVCCGSTTRYI